MKNLTASVIMALATASLISCSKDKRDMTFEQFSNLPQSEKEGFSKELNGQEMEDLMSGAMMHAMDTVALKKMTLRQVIADGRKAREEKKQ